MPEIELDAATRQRYLGIVSAETHRLERLIGDLLDLARLEGGGGSLRRDTRRPAAARSSAWPRGTSATCATGGSISRSTIGDGASHRDRRRRPARAGACRTLPPTRCAIRPDGGQSLDRSQPPRHRRRARRPRHRPGDSGRASAARSSTGSTRPTPRAARPVAAGWAFRSSRPSSSVMAAR